MEENANTLPQLEEPDRDPSVRMVLFPVLIMDEGLYLESIFMKTLNQILIVNPLLDFPELCITIAQDKKTAEVNIKVSLSNQKEILTCQKR